MGDNFIDSVLRWKPNILPLPPPPSTTLLSQQVKSAVMFLPLIFQVTLPVAAELAGPPQGP